MLISIIDAREAISFSVFIFFINVAWLYMIVNTVNLDL